MFPRRKKMMDMNDDGSESDARSTLSSSSRAERRMISSDGAENHRLHLMNRDKKRSDELRAKIALDFDYLAVHDEKEEVGFRRSKQAAGVRNADLSEMNGFRRGRRMYKEGMRYSNVGSSNFLPKSSHEYGNIMRNGSDYMDELNTFDDAGRDRTVHELKDQFTRPDKMSNMGKEKVPFDGGVAHPEPYISKHSTVDTSLGMSRGALQHSHIDSQIRRPSYQTQYDDPPPLMRRQEMGSNGHFPPRQDQGYGDPLRSQMLRENPLKTSALNQYQPSIAYIPERYMSDGMVYADSMDTYAPNVSCHHPSCSCFRCQNKREVPVSFQSSAYSDKFSDVRNHMMFNNHGNHGSCGPREYNRGMSNSSSVRSQNPQLNTRWPSDIKPEVDGVVRSRPHRVHIPSGGQHCRPIADGAPFLMCHICFELLHLPKKILSQNSDRKKMRCGACSRVIFFTVLNKNLVVLIEDVEEMDAPVNVDNNRVMLPTPVDGRVNQARMIFSSDDFDDSRFDFQPTDRDTGNGRDNKFLDLKNRHSTPDGEISTVAPKGSNPIELPARSKGTPPLAGSVLVESFGYSNEYHGENNFGESDKILPSKTSTRQISMNDSSPVTEIDISTNEYANTGTTFNSGEGSSTQGGHGAESFFAGIKDRIFRDSNETNQTVVPEKASVTVNGHLISDRLIKKAERLAGPIHPGHYWYDFRAGFWGVIGGPCLGIIPPFIPELHHHMPENCSGGNTHVYVNGRELSQKDLNLLGRRGMPTERDRSYILEISGRILDEDTGEELTGLGKLAPTVEKAKHGFGMRDPNEAARTSAV